ncbi:uncharacterized protein LOC111239380 [Seriola dumerili]|uniref:uncharacterized protein LOC111239380 n=1 Tax=Seriola dumerili TaxID=41447 RepID=UPI000BBE26F5|nr:uncharacterized protein LOC111239380 [Seriola dumerili]
MTSVAVILGLLVCIEAPGSSAVTPVFAQRGENVHLEITEADNLQEADSGVYTARAIGAQGDKILAGYSVTVQDPVSPVALTVDSVSSSSDSCSLTVTCSTQDSHHINSTFTCDTNTCSQEGGERSKVTTSGASLHVQLLNDSIICNHSNQVSWEKDSKLTEYLCAGHKRPEAGISLCLVKTVVFSVGLVIMVSAVISVHLMEKLKRHK